MTTAEEVTRHLMEVRTKYFAPDGSDTRRHLEDYAAILRGGDAVKEVEALDNTPGMHSDTQLGVAWKDLASRLAARCAMLEAQAVPEPCCGEFDSCERRCIPLALELRRRLTTNAKQMYDNGLKDGKAERDQIEAATIERCAKAAEDHLFHVPVHRADVPARIRALAAQPEKDPHHSEARMVPGHAGIVDADGKPAEQRGAEAVAWMVYTNGSDFDFMVYTSRHEAESTAMEQEPESKAIPLFAAPAPIPADVVMVPAEWLSRLCGGFNEMTSALMERRNMLAAKPSEPPK